MAGLDTELNKVRNSGVSNTTVAKASGVIHYDGGKLTIHKLIQVKVDRNYNKNYSDMTYIECYMPLGNYVKHIHPSRDNLYVTLFQERGVHKSLDKYKAIVLNADRNVENPDFTRATTEELNTELAFIRFQLIERVTYEMLQRNVNLTIRNKNLLEFTTCVMREDFDSIQIPDSKYKMTFSMVPPHNEKVWEHILLPTMLPTLDVPAYLQSKEYGLYKGGVGTYIQCYDRLTGPDTYESNRVLWVYPLYSTDDTNRKTRKLKAYISKRKEDSYIERSYFIDPSLSVRILATTDDELRVRNLTAKLKVGNDDVHMECDSIMNRSHKVNETDTAKTKSDMIDDEELKPMEDGSKHSTYHGTKSNAYNIVTDNLRVNGRFIAIQWKFSVPDYLFPGMLVELYWEEEVDGQMKVNKINGVLHGSYTILEANQEMSITSLIIFISN